MTSDRRVIVTGGTGLIGRALADRLARDGADLVILTRGEPGDSGGRHVPGGGRIRRVRWDARSADGWLAEASGAAAIVNLAGESIASGRWTAARKRRILESRLAAARAVGDAFARADPRPGALLQASAVGFYGDRGDEPLDDRSAPGVGFLAETTTAWEAASESIEAAGTRRVLLRTGLVLDPEGGALRKMLLPFRLGLGARLGDGRQWMPWIHHDDEIEAIRFLLASDAATGPYVLAAPRPVTNAEFTRALARALHRPAFLAAPSPALRLALGELATAVLGGQRLVPERLLEAGFEFRFPELGPALVDLLRRPRA